MTLLLIFIASYGLCSIPFGLVVAGLMGLGDLRKLGSGNIGATNVLRTGNKFAAGLTLIFDLGKGGVAVLLARMITDEPLMIAMAAVLAVLGHCYPIWLGFKGGKGVATGIGVVLAINFLSGLVMAGVWLITAGMSRLSSAAALLAYAVAPIAVYIWAEASSAFAVLVISMIAFWRHRSNIQRLIEKTEPKIGEK